MKQSIILTLAIVSALTIWGCKPEDKPKPVTKENATHQCTDPSHNHAHDNKTADEHNHDQQAGQPHAHDGDGEKYDLGKKQAGDFTVAVIQIGTFTPSSTELAFEITVTGPNDPEAVRALIKAGDGSESLKSKADKTGATTYHLHVSELPKKVEGSNLLVEVATSEGKVTADFTVQH